MLHWLAVILGVLFAVFQIFYAFIIISNLIENTGYTIPSVIIGILHAGLPAAFVFFAYQALLRKAAQYGLLKALLGIIACAVVYLLIVSIWNRIVLGDTPEMWKIVLLTAAQAVVSCLFIYAFLFL